jgi:hypothetical protein
MRTRWKSYSFIKEGTREGFNGRMNETTPTNTTYTHTHISTSKERTTYDDETSNGRESRLIPNEFRVD